MKEKTRTITRSYTYSSTYSVDIVEKPGIYEAWLYKTGRQYTSHKTYMFGLPKSNRHTYDEILRIVENNIPDYTGLLNEEIDTLTEAAEAAFYAA